MKRKALRAWCETRLDELHVPCYFDVHGFCVALEHKRERAILLHPVPHLGEFTGLWVAGAKSDHIFFEQDTSPVHQDLIIFHELSHLLLEHQPTPVTKGELPELLFPHVNPKSAAHVLRRAGYSRQEEREAELLAMLILERTVRPLPAPKSAADPAAARLVNRLAMALSGPNE